MIGNIKKLFPPRTGMQKKQVLQDPGYVRGAEGPCCMLHAILQLAHVKGVKRNKKKQNRFDLRSLFPMSEMSESLYENIYKATFKKFICHVRGVEGSVHIH